MTIDSNKLHSFIITSSSISFYLCNYGEMDCHVFSIFHLEIDQVSFPSSLTMNNGIILEISIGVMSRSKNVSHTLTSG